MGGGGGRFIRARVQCVVLMWPGFVGQGRVCLLGVRQRVGLVAGERGRVGGLNHKVERGGGGPAAWQPTR